MNLIEDLKARGLIEHQSADLEKIFSKNRTVYLGVDPSADSMQAGNLAVILLMKRLAGAGHRIILLVGGGTGMIGDPRESGERQLPDAKLVARNAKALRDQMQRIIGTRVTLVNNADWLMKIRLVDFLRDIGKHFTVNELIKRDIIKRRIEDPNESISYTEFAYSLLQGYDYMVLNQKYGCDVQVGGSDQWTNLLSGVELIRRKLAKEAYAITIPLVTDSTGKKFGKSEGNAVWLSAAKTSPFLFYQFWLGQADSEVGKLMKIYTFLSPSEINALLELHERNPERRTAQRRLAHEVTALVHGKTEADRAEKFTEVLFGNAPYDSLTEPERELLFAAVPSTTVAGGTDIVEALTMSGFIASKSEARRLIDAKGIRLNGEIVTGEHTLAEADFNRGLAILQRGKSEKLLVRINRYHGNRMGATFWPIDKDHIRAQLKAAGATLIYPERRMRRVNLYPPDEEYANRAWVRVRDEGDRITLSLKERRGDNSQIEHQGEIELTIDNFERAQELLRLLGCRDKNYQETNRELWKLSGAEVTIDEWPWLDPFVEIEGISQEQVKDVATKLGFEWEKARFDTADKIYAEKYAVQYQYVNRMIPRLTFDGPNPFQNKGEAGIVP